MENKEIQTFREIRKTTLIIIVVMFAVSLLLNNFKAYSVGILLGGVTSLLSFQMIINMVYRLGDQDKARGTATSNYVFRIMLCVCVFALGASEGASIIAMLAGFLTNKLAIMIYSYRHSKEDDE
ncbi:MAG: ATP synthase subunit I [Erysipelotrichaceae bacterium]